MELDQKNCQILNLLQENCRMSLTEIADKIGLSVDSIKKRIDKLKGEVFFPRIQLRPRHFGYPIIVDVKVKLQSFAKPQIDNFVAYTKAHPRVAELIAISGEYDFNLVLIAQNYTDLARLSNEIRSKFGQFIKDWAESMSTHVHKFESYDLISLMKYENDSKKI